MIGAVLLVGVAVAIVAALIKGAEKVQEETGKPFRDL